MSNPTDTLAPSTASDAVRLRESFSAMRVTFSWMGARKSLSRDQRSLAALQFNAEQKAISAGKKLFDGSHPAIKAINHVKRDIIGFWRGNSLPYPEPSVRLVRRVDLDILSDRMSLFERELRQAADRLQADYAQVKLQARRRLGELYCESDYPERVANHYEVAWEFPSVEPPDYLRQLQPELYAAECKRIKHRFAEAAELAEQAFVEELSGLISHLGERLAGSDDGKPKVFRDSAVDHLSDFFQRFKRLSVSSDRELDSLIERAQNVLTGVGPQDLRDSSSLRQEVATQLSGVQSVLDGLMVDRPRRRIIR